MDKGTGRIKCKTCGSIINSNDKVDKIINESKKALKRYYNKHIRKQKWLILVKEKTSLKK